MKRIQFVILGICAVLLVTAVKSNDVVTAAAPAQIQAGEEKYISLTFDDGPSAQTTGKLLDGLNERGVNATFFLIGELIEGNESLVLRMKEDGHQIGNHTWSHVNLQEVSLSVAEEELQRTDAALTNLLGAGDYWVRPPYGAITDRQRQIFCTPAIKWSVDPEDWKKQNVAADVEAVLSAVEPGDIILMHDIYPETVTAALKIIDTLQKQGYTFVTVESLLELEGTTPQVGTIYCTAKQTI